jgi:lipoprotein-anchoring transpeptidase ErfK/SrfK
MKRIFTHLSLAVLGGLLSSCGTTGTGSLNPAGSTSYLGANLPDGTTENALFADNVSFWDGGAGNGPARVHVRLGDQIADFYRGDVLVGRSRISSGTAERPTPVGSYRVMQKDKNHRSSRYGDFVFPDGTFAQRDVDVKLNRPPGGSKFLGSKMTNFMRLTPDGVGMHAGFLPGYAASHGCIRMPDAMSETFFNNVREGTPVKVTY